MEFSFSLYDGFIDGKGKTFLDRLIQHSLPYIKLRNGECGHLKRYDTYPVMNFFERLKPVNQEAIHMAFIIQSGFPETSQSYYLRPYLEILTKRLGVSFDGIIIKGGMEGLRIQPEKANAKIFEQIQTIGKTYALTGVMDQNLKKEYEKEEYLPKMNQFFFSLFSLTGLTNIYWDYNLKKNKAFKNRYARPYQ